MSARPTILLTGATGVVGSALLPMLQRHFSVISLTRRGRVDSEQVHGDIARPRLGLDQMTYKTLCDQVDFVVHAAAVTDFAAGAQTIQELNVAGTGRICDFTADSKARLLYVSTAFVARAELTRSATGNDLREAVARPEDYLDSKRAAEHLVGASGVPAAIVRPSVVIGDSATGHIVRLQGLHTIASAVLKNQLPLVPLEPFSRIDFIPQDVVARALTALVRAGIPDGVHWLSAGPQALTAQSMLGFCVATAQRLGIAVTAPRLVVPDMVERLIRPVFIDPLPPPARRRFDDLLAMTALFSGAHPFPTSLGAIPGTQAPTPQALESSFAASVRYLALAKGLVDERAAELTEVAA